VDISWGYRHEGRVIKELVRKIPNDLVAQENLSRMLQDSEPMFEPTVVGNEETAIRYALMLGEALGTPVVLMSSGKTASSKSEVRGHEAGRTGIGNVRPIEIDRPSV